MPGTHQRHAFIHLNTWLWYALVPLVKAASALVRAIQNPLDFPTLTY